MVSANWVRLSSGKLGRSRNSGMPNEKPLVMKVCGDRPPTELVGSPAFGAWLNSYSKSCPYWKRASLIIFGDRVDATRTLRFLARTKSSPKLSFDLVLIAWV